MIQILPDKMTEMRLRSVVLMVPVIMFVEEHSLKVLAVHLGKKLT